MIVFTNKTEVCNYLKYRFKRLKYFNYFLINSLTFLISLLLTGFITVSIVILLSSLGLLLLPLFTSITLLEIMTILLLTSITLFVSVIISRLFFNYINAKMNQFNFKNLKDYHTIYNIWKQKCIEENDYIDVKILD